MSVAAAKVIRGKTTRTLEANGFKHKKELDDNSVKSKYRIEGAVITIWNSHGHAYSKSHTNPRKHLQEIVQKFHLDLDELE